MAVAAGAAGGLTLRAAGGPQHVAGLLAHLGPRAMPGVEELAGARYRRVLRLPGGTGLADVRLAPGGARGSLWLEEPADRPAARAALRALLALDVDPGPADAALARDPLLARHVAAAPGVRVPGAADGAELAVRAVLGQQVTVVAARTAAAGLAAALGRALPVTDGALRCAFPAPEAIAQAPDALLRMPRARQRAVRAVAAAIAGGEADVRRGADPARLRAALLELPGVGPWTAEYVAMRAAGDPDAFPATDLGILRGAAAAGLPATARELAAHAERWRPFRSSAAQRLWLLSAA